MNMWTKQKGYPLLKVSMEQQDDNRIITITQEKFTSTVSDSQCNNKTQSLWSIPINIVSSDYKNLVCIK